MVRSLYKNICEISIPKSRRASTSSSKIIFLAENQNVSLNIRHWPRNPFKFSMPNICRIVFLAQIKFTMIRSVLSAKKKFFPMSKTCEVILPFSCSNLQKYCNFRFDFRKKTYNYNRFKTFNNLCILCL